MVNAARNLALESQRSIDAERERDPSLGSRLNRQNNERAEQRDNGRLICVSGDALSGARCLSHDWEVAETLCNALGNLAQAFLSFTVPCFIFSSNISSLST